MMLDNPTFAKDAKNKDKLSEYEPIDESLSYRGLKMVGWYLKHKILLQKIGIGSLLVWCVVTVGYSGFQWGNYLFFGYWKDIDAMKRQMSEFPNYERLHLIYGAKDLQLKQSNIFRGGSDRFDFSTEVINPNERWLAMVSYKYVYQGGETDLEEVLILPQSTQPVVVLGQELSNTPQQVQLVIENIVWKSINPHEISDVGAYMNERMDFFVDNVIFTKANRDGLSVHRLEFDIFNNSAYSYWQPLFYITLFDGGQITGVTKLNLEQFRAGDQEHVDLRFFATSLNITNIKVMPVFNIFDEGVYIEPGG